MLVKSRLRTILQHLRYSFLADTAQHMILEVTSEMSLLHKEVVHQQSDPVPVSEVSNTHHLSQTSE